VLGLDEDLAAAPFASCVLQRFSRGRDLEWTFTFAIRVHHETDSSLLVRIEPNVHSLHL
jgi:hypothetical protein